MQFEPLLANIKRFAQLSLEDEEALCALLTTRQLKRKEFLLREGEECLYENYIVKGCLRTYYLDNKGLEHNLYFAIEDWWISDIYSRTFAAPSFCNIVAVEDCELIQITNAALESFMKERPALERFFRIAYQNGLAISHLNVLQMFSMTGEERYRFFRQNYPVFDKRIPQKHIATYLGFTPEHFNKIRSKVLREK